MKIFNSANILLPKTSSYHKWAVVACDQYSSNPDYWNRVHEAIQDEPSTLQVILPEAWLGTDREKSHQEKIRPAMEAFLKQKLLKEYPDSFIYVERTLADGTIRQGLVGALDLEAYDYHCPSTFPVRATEATILERIPPRAEIRKEAILEFPHILLLQNDSQDILFQGLLSIREQLPVVYDFDLMENGGHITGRLVNGSFKKEIEAWLDRYEQEVRQASGPDSNPLLYAVGDGNHSLAAAKSVWNLIRQDLDEEQSLVHPSRYALAELENLHHRAQKFEPIHRILKNVDPSALLASFPPADPEMAYPIRWISGDKEGTIYLDASLSPLPLAVLQKHLDAWLEENPGEIDYIHGESDLEQLAASPHNVGFFLPVIEKDSLFKTIINDGSLPRKTFSMGHAHEKRYYLEGKVLQPLEEKE